MEAAAHNVIVKSYSIKSSILDMAGVPDPPLITTVINK